MEPAPAEPSRTPDPGFAGRPFPGLEPPSPVLGALSPVTPPVAHSGLGCVGRCAHAACLRARSPPPPARPAALAPVPQELGCRWHGWAGRATPPPLPPPPPLVSRGLCAASAPAAAAAAACDSPPLPFLPPLSLLFIYLFPWPQSSSSGCARAGCTVVLGQELARVCARGRACACLEGAPSLSGSGGGVQKRKK